MLVSFASYAHSDDEFKAFPGLWKTTLVGLSPQKHSPLVKWHCVFEGSDPWTDFAYLRDLSMERVNAFTPTERAPH
jgi:hypothetical protein